LSAEERKTLLAWSRGRSTPARLVLRAKIVLAAAEGKMNQEIAADLRTSRKTVSRQEWIKFLKLIDAQTDA
jgi:putative transposase